MSITVDGTNGITVPKVTSAGLVDISGAAAGQIKFPAAQNASADANTLDDYEEGTFTPTIVGTSTAGTGTYTTQVGRYTKVGNLVTIMIYLTWSAHTGTGNMRVAGAPFNTDAGNQEWVAFIDSSGLTVPANSIPAVYFPGNASQLVVASQNTTGTPGLGALALDTSATIVLNLTYQTA
jgi:hypothetical protein